MPRTPNSLAALTSAVKKKGVREAVFLLKSSPALIPAAIKAYPEILAYLVGLVSVDAASVPPADVAAALASLLTHDTYGDWFNDWSEELDRFVSAVYARDPAAFDQVSTDNQTARRAMLLIKRRFGAIPVQDAAELQPLVFQHLRRDHFPRRVFGPDGEVATSLAPDGAPRLGPVYAFLFGSEEAALDALRKHVIASFETDSPRQDLIPVVLAGADDADLEQLLVGGEKSTAQTGLWLSDFARAVRASGIPADRFLAVARRLAPDAHGASLAAWGALLAGGPAVYPVDLDDRIDFAPCTVRITDDDNRPLPDVPLMREVLGGLSLARRRAIVARNLTFTRAEGWPADWFPNPYSTAFAFLDWLEHPATWVARHGVDRQTAAAGVSDQGPTVRFALWDKWSSIEYSGHPTARLLFDLEDDDSGDDRKLTALSTLRCAAMLGETLPDAFDDVLVYGADLWAPGSLIDDLVPRLLPAPRERLLAYMAGSSSVGPSKYGSAIAFDLTPARLQPFVKAKTKLRDLLQSALSSDDLRNPDALDAWLPGLVTRSAIKLESYHRERLVERWGADRIAQWFDGARPVVAAKTSTKGASKTAAPEPKKAAVADKAASKATAPAKAASKTTVPARSTATKADKTTATKAKPTATKAAAAKPTSKTTAKAPGKTAVAKALGKATTTKAAGKGSSPGKAARR